MNVLPLPPPRDDLGGKPVPVSWMKWFTSLRQNANVALSITELPLIVRTPSTILTDEQALSALSTGYLKVTTATGVLTSQAIPIPVIAGGTGLIIGTSGGVLGFTGTTTLASSVLLTQYALVLGAGAGATPVPMGSLGTATTVLHGAAAGAPTFGAVSLTADVSGTLPVTSGGTGVALSTGTVAVVLSTSPTLVTPILGVASVTSLTFDEAGNVILGTTTGTKIGTATSQKLGFYNATPIVQGTAVGDAAGGATVDAEARAALNALISRIEATGLIATI